MKIKNSSGPIIYLHYCSWPQQLPSFILFSIQLQSQIQTFFLYHQSWLQVFSLSLITSLFHLVLHFFFPTDTFWFQFHLCYKQRGSVLTLTSGFTPFPNVYNHNSSQLTFLSIFWDSSHISSTLLQLTNICDHQLLFLTKSTINKAIFAYLILLN